jgi:hypothetical protein
MANVLPDRLLTDMVALVQGLNLQGSQDGNGNTITPNLGTNVFDQMTFDESNVAWPACIVTYEDESEEEGESTFESDVVIYPVRVLIADRVSERWQQSRPDYLRWRHSIAQTLRGLVDQPLLPNCPELFDVRLRNLKIFDPRTREYQFVVTGLIAQCYTAEPRQRNTP